jgi:hypothetical protein
MSSWQQLALEGWERGENDAGKKFYLTPFKDGFRKKIYQSRDIPLAHSHLKEILYPPKVTTISFMACVFACICTYLYCDDPYR